MPFCTGSWKYPEPEQIVRRKTKRSPDTDQICFCHVKSSRNDTVHLNASGRRRQRNAADIDVDINQVYRGTCGRGGRKSNPSRLSTRKEALLLPKSPLGLRDLAAPFLFVARGGARHILSFEKRFSYRALIAGAETGSVALA